MAVTSAVFDSTAEADRAVSELRSMGVSDSAISVVAQRDGTNTTTDGSGAEEAVDMVGKVAAGAGVGTLLGIAALAIPGVGPLVAAGAIAAAAVPGAALTGAAIGAAAGGLSKLLTDHGVDANDAGYYETRINSGGVFVSVDTGASMSSGMGGGTSMGSTGSMGGNTRTGSTMDAGTIADVLYRAGGHSYGRSKVM